MRRSKWGKLRGDARPHDGQRFLLPRCTALAKSFNMTTTVSKSTGRKTSLEGSTLPSSRHVRISSRSRTLCLTSGSQFEALDARSVFCLVALAPDSRAPRCRCRKRVSHTSFHNRATLLPKTHEIVTSEFRNLFCIASNRNKLCGCCGGQIYVKP
jgi:hypothetical protein